jgi:hypothetical protein
MLHNFQICVIASDIHCSGHIGAIIVSYSYCYKLMDQRYCFYSLSLFRYYVPYLLFTSPIPLSNELEGDLNFFPQISLSIHVHSKLNILLKVVGAYCYSVKAIMLRYILR